MAESYPFGGCRGLLLSADNHNSVNGMHEFARSAGAPIRYVALDDAADIDRALDLVASFL